jgi:hypothetical protein
MMLEQTRNSERGTRNRLAGIIAVDPTLLFRVSTFAFRVPGAGGVWP